MARGELASRIILRGRKTYWKDTESKDISCWSLWTADLLSDVQYIENYFIKCKGDGGRNGRGNGFQQDRLRLYFVSRKGQLSQIIL